MYWAPLGGISTIRILDLVSWGSHGLMDRELDL